MFGLSKQDSLSILITMVTGFVTGAYLYLVGFAPQVEKIVTQIEPNSTPSLVIVGDAYGGIRAGTSPSFRIVSDGSYRYVPMVPRGEVAEPQSGTLPDLWYEPLLPFLTADILSAAATVREPVDCVSFVDAIDYTYNITWDDELYTLDTCTTGLVNNAELAAALADLWNYFMLRE